MIWDGRGGKIDSDGEGLDTSAATWPVLITAGASVMLDCSISPNPAQQINFVADPRTRGCDTAVLAVS